MGAATDFQRSFRRSFFKNPAQRLGRDALGTTSARRFLLQHIARRQEQFETPPILACQPLNDRIGGLPGPGIENLDLTGIRADADGRALSIEDHGDSRLGPVLVIPQSFGQGVPGERTPARVELAQFRPGKNHAVAVNDEVFRAHLPGNDRPKTGGARPKCYVSSGAAVACFFALAFVGLGASRRAGAAFAAVFLRSR
jgi:hypothetical protein